MGQIILLKGDICQQKTEAIVNAANNDLLHGGGVAAAIVKCGGEIIQAESNKIAPIALGEAAVTTGGKLPAKYVIHAASMKLGELASESNVEKSIINSFKRAIELGLKTIALPAVGAGIAKLPMRKCAEISLAQAKKFIDRLDQIVFVLNSQETLNIFNEIYNQEMK